MVEVVEVVKVANLVAVIFWSKKSYLNTIATIIPLTSLIFIIIAHFSLLIFAVDISLSLSGYLVIPSS